MGRLQHRKHKNKQTGGVLKFNKNIIYTDLLEGAVGPGWSQRDAFEHLNNSANGRQLINIAEIQAERDEIYLRTVNLPVAAPAAPVAPAPAAPAAPVAPVAAPAAAAPVAAPVAEIIRIGDDLWGSEDHIVKIREAHIDRMVTRGLTEYDINEDVGPDEMFSTVTEFNKDLLEQEERRQQRIIRAAPPAPAVPAVAVPAPAAAAAPVAAAAEHGQDVFDIVEHNANEHPIKLRKCAFCFQIYKSTDGIECNTAPLDVNGWQMRNATGDIISHFLCGTNTPDNPIYSVNHAITRYMGQEPEHTEQEAMEWLAANFEERIIPLDDEERVESGRCFEDTVNYKLLQYIPNNFQDIWNFKYAGNICCRNVLNDVEHRHWHILEDNEVHTEDPYLIEQIARLTSQELLQTWREALVRRQEALDDPRTAEFGPDPDGDKDCTGRIIRSLLRHWLSWIYKKTNKYMDKVKVFAEPIVQTGLMTTEKIWIRYGGSPFFWTNHRMSDIRWWLRMHGRREELGGSLSEDNYISIEDAMRYLDNALDEIRGEDNVSVAVILERTRNNIGRDIERGRIRRIDGAPDQLNPEDYLINNYD